MIINGRNIPTIYHCPFFGEAALFIMFLRNKFGEGKFGMDENAYFHKQKDYVQAYET